MIIHDQPLVTIFGNHCFIIMSRMLIIIDQYYLVGGIPTPLKNITVVSWDDDIPDWMEK